MKKAFFLAFTIYLSTACTAQGADLRYDGYACCNLHYIENENWISDANYTAQPFIPAGTPIEIQQGSRAYRTGAKIYGADYRFGLDEAWQLESLENWLRRIVVSENPQSKIDSWPQEIRHAIRLGKIRIGMTREQVTVALGPPSKAKNPSIDATNWLYQHNSNADSEYAVHFDKGLVAKVTYKVNTVPQILENGRVEVVF